ncbi:MAG: VWA domain-containing protein [Ruminococcaceae bacterium]|nr:VWA domain-containing protein [Oscillospiraceae bacterium]
MKGIKKILSVLMVIVLLFVMSACSGSASDRYGGIFTESMAPGEASPDDSTDENAPTEEQVTLPSGMITAGAWNDNDNYTMWQNLFYQAPGETEPAKFQQYTEAANSWGFNSLTRVKVTVTKEGQPIAGAKVEAFDRSNNAIFCAVSDAKGNAYLFTTEDAGSIRVTSGSASAQTAFTAEEKELTVALDSAIEKRNVIEIMFVVDVTGSMGDELRFLKAELADVISKIARNDSETAIKLALLFYRDTDDKVPFAYYDFEDVTTQSGMQKQQAALDSQQPDGGGDYPEAVDAALELAVHKQWSTGATTKLIFHVLDAPAHGETKHQEKFHNAVLSAAEKGIRISPIICSGAAELTEYTMRQAAIYTGGTFIFVTDDSGIGGEHHDPGLPNATVELLNTMLVRLVKGYHTGDFDAPIYWQDDPALNIG